MNRGCKEEHTEVALVIQDQCHLLMMRDNCDNIGNSGNNEIRPELAVAMDGRGATPRHSVDLVGKVLPMPQHMHAQLHKQYVAQSGTKLSCQTRLQSTHEVVIVIPGRLLILGRGKTRTVLQEHTCQT